MISVLLLATLACSAFSGAFGMAGGLALMGVFVTLLPVPEAMVLHGLAMGTANTCRAWLLREHVRWDLVRRYLAGAAPAAALASALLWFGAPPPQCGLLLLLGVLPLLVMLLPANTLPGVEERRGAECSGLLVTFTQVVAGVSGPLLDAFYLRGGLDRRTVVGTKAATQVVGHGLKVVLYGLVAGSGAGIPATGTGAGVCAAALAGTVLGRTLLDGMSEGAFRRGVRALVLLLCGILLWRGLEP